MMFPEQEAIRAKCFHPSGMFVEFPKEDIETSIPDRFEQIVRQYAHRSAVKTRDNSLTYDELNKAANRVAHAILTQRGEGEEAVTLLMRNGAPMIAAILGALKAKKSYVPLDPSYPRARLTSILEDSQAGLILTDNKNLCLAKELTLGVCGLLNVDDLDVGLSTENLGLFMSADSVACIFYTSGSTGEPKGVIQAHRNVLHRVMVDTNSFHICPDDRLSLLSSPSYSVSLRNLFGTLLNGASLYAFNIEEEGLAHLADWLIQEKVTIYFSVPTVFHHFTDKLRESECFGMLRLIYLGGEPTTKKDVELYKKYFSPACILVNSLASNEAGIIRNYFIDKETQIRGSIVPAGYAVDGKEILVLNDDGQEVDCNQIGEIVVRSRYLCPGYWQKSDLTRASFLSDPAGGKERIYRTGDLGRIGPDGCLEHLGRKDFRVKIRGQRVEVAEVEMTLLNHHAIKEAVIRAVENEPDDPSAPLRTDQRLVAYVVPKQGQAPTISELRGFLRGKLTRLYGAVCLCVLGPFASAA